MSDPQKIVIDVELKCQKCKQRALSTAADAEGVDSVSVEKDSKIIVIGNPDTVSLVTSLQKYGYAQLVSVGPAKEPQKPKPEPPKPQPPEDLPKPEPPVIVFVPQCAHFNDENPNFCAIL